MRAISAAFLAVAVFTGCATNGDGPGAEPVLDGSSPAAFQASLGRMAETLSDAEQKQLLVALFRLQFEGFESASEVGRKPLKEIPIEELDGMTFRQVLAHVDREADVDAFLEGQEPGLSPRFSRPLPDDGGKDGVSEIAGSAWRITSDTNGHIRHQEVTFLADGTFETDEGGRDNPEPERWQRHHDRLRLSFNGGYAVYLGTLESRDRMAGEGQNINGTTWTWKATRISE